MKIVEIKSDHVDVRNGSSGGRDYSIRTQTGWWHKKNEPYPSRVAINLDGDQHAYTPGMYTIDTDESVYIGRYDRPMLGRLVLVPTKQA